MTFPPPLSSVFLRSFTFSLVGFLILLTYSARPSPHTSLRKHKFADGDAVILSPPVSFCICVSLLPSASVFPSFLPARTEEASLLQSESSGPVSHLPRTSRLQRLLCPAASSLSSLLDRSIRMTWYGGAHPKSRKPCIPDPPATASYLHPPSQPDFLKPAVCT